MRTGVIPSRPAVSQRRISRRKLVIGAIIGAAVAAVLLATDLMTGYYQEHLVEQRRERLKQLQRMAWFHLRADVSDVAYTPEGKYQLTVWLENVFPERDFFVMAPSIRAFIQIGPRWVEVPAKEIAEDRLLSSGTVVNLKEKIYAGTVFEIAMDNYFELLPGFMHVKFDNTMFVSPDAEPKEDIIERADTYYIHLRPINADDAQLRRLNQFPGPVPRWIGMPPH
jgi:hypothetical protein